MPEKLDSCVKDVTSKNKTKFVESKGRQPNTQEAKEIESSAWAICKSNLQMAEPQLKATGDTTNCSMVKQEFDNIKKTGKGIPNDLMMKAVECGIIKQEELKGKVPEQKAQPPIPTAPQMATPPAMEMAESYFYDGSTGEWVSINSSADLTPEQLQYVADNPSLYSGQGGGYNTLDESGTVVHHDTARSTYVDPSTMKDIGGGQEQTTAGGQVSSNKNYFQNYGGQTPNAPYKKGGVWVTPNAPANDNPYDKAMAGGTQTTYTREANQDNLTPHTVQANRPFSNDESMEEWLKRQKRLPKEDVEMAGEMMEAKETNVNTGNVGEGNTPEIDEQMESLIKQALTNAGLNVTDMELDQEGKIWVAISQFEDSYIENAYFELAFELAEAPSCKRVFKAIAVTPGVYSSKANKDVELAKEDLQKISKLFRNKPLVLVDHDQARPDSTHEGTIVGKVKDSWYDDNLGAVVYSGLINDGIDLDLASIEGSSIKVSMGNPPIADHIALIPKCRSGRPCYLPQDSNAVILENAQRGNEMEKGMYISPDKMKALEKEIADKNKLKEDAVNVIVNGYLEDKKIQPKQITDTIRDLWTKDTSTLLEMASIYHGEETDKETTVSPKDSRKTISLAKRVESGELSPEEALELAIDKEEFWKGE